MPANATAIPAATTELCRPGLWARLWAHVGLVNAAHARQLRFSGEMAQISRDIGLPVEVLLNETAYDPNLPFFMQSGFDRRD